LENTVTVRFKDDVNNVIVLVIDS